MNREIEDHEVKTPIGPYPGTDYIVSTDKLFNLAGDMRFNVNNTIGTLLTQVEAILGETKQAEAYKQLVKWEMWRLADNNQQRMYDCFDKSKQFETAPVAPLQKEDN